MKYTFKCEKCGMICNSPKHFEAPFMFEHGDPQCCANYVNGALFEHIHHNVVNYKKCEGIFYRVWQPTPVIFKGTGYIGKVG